MPELLLKMSTAAGQLREPLLEVHRVMQVRGGKVQGSHLFTSLSMECTEERETELQGMLQGELQCVILQKRSSESFQLQLVTNRAQCIFHFICPSVGANFEVDQSVFEIPKSYHIQDDGRNIHVQDEDNEIMQFAIQQSLLESGGNKVSAGICAVAASCNGEELESYLPQVSLEVFPVM